VLFLSLSAFSNVNISRYFNISCTHTHAHKRIVPFIICAAKGETQQEQEEEEEEVDEKATTHQGERGAVKSVTLDVQRRRKCTGRQGGLVEGLAVEHGGLLLGVWMKEKGVKSA